MVHGNHCGTVTASNFPDGDRLQTRQFVGAAQIVDGNGQVVARKQFSEGAGFVISDISWDTTNRKSANDFPSDYWIPELPDSYLNAWKNINPKGKLYYEDITLPYYKNAASHNEN